MDVITALVQSLVDQAKAAIPELAAQGLVALFEPVKMSFPGHPAKSAAVTRAIRRTEPDGVTKFRTAKGREDFLWSALSYLSPIRGHEELLMAFGRSHGRDRSSPSRLEGVWRGVGDARSVRLTPRAEGIIRERLAMDRGQVILVHNHPPNLIKTIMAKTLGWRPIASETDRETALLRNLSTFLRDPTTGFGTALRWYLVDEGEMSEFYLPSLRRTLAALGTSARTQSAKP
jgi:hypothetical protein